VRRLTETDAQAVLLVQAFEEVDVEGQLLPPRDRERATADALEQLADDEAKPIVARARRLVDELHGRVPLVRQVLRASRLGAGLGPSVFGLAVVLGLASNSLGPGQRINILFGPMLGLVAWNVAVYLAIAVWPWLRRRRSAAGGQEDAHGEAGHLALRAAAERGGRFTVGLAHWIVDRWASRSRARQLRDHALLSTVFARYADLWREASVALVVARLRRLLHLGALALVAGTVAGMYVRGLGLEYRASWESTFLGPEQADVVQALLDVVLGPAAVVLGAPVPDVAPLRGPDATGDAAYWIHLYAVTGALLVVVPRAALAAWEGVRCRRLAAELPVDLATTYFRRMLAAGRGGASSVVVTPYSHRPSARASETLRALLHDVFGARAEVHVDGALEYGDDPPAAAGHRAGGDEVDRCHAILFSLAQSPESEVHGRFLQELKRRLAEGKRLLVLVDGASFRRHAGTLGQRLAQRRRSWDRVVREAGLEAAHVDLEHAGDGGSETVDVLGAVWPAIP